MEKRLGETEAEAGPPNLGEGGAADGDVAGGGVENDAASGGGANDETTDSAGQNDGAGDGPSNGGGADGGAQDDGGGGGGAEGSGSSAAEAEAVCPVCQDQLADTWELTICCTKAVHPACYMRWVAGAYEDVGSDAEECRVQAVPTCVWCRVVLRHTSRRRLLRAPTPAPMP